jgi:hypothetical protein
LFVMEVGVAGSARRTLCFSNMSSRNTVSLNLFDKDLLVDLNH